MLKAGFDANVPWNMGRTWWAAVSNIPEFSLVMLDPDGLSKTWVPRRQFEELGLMDRRTGGYPASATRTREYIPIPEHH
jgi:hypothetical protein